MTSVNTNYGALVALQNLNATNRGMEEVQSRINTGMKVNSARDNGAVFAIAEQMRTRVSAVMAVRDGIDRANMTVDTSLAAATAIGDILKQMKEKAVQAQGAGLTLDDKRVLQLDFAALRQQINQMANSAEFNGVNLINGSMGLAGMPVLTTERGAAGSGGQYFPGATSPTGYHRLSPQMPLTGLQADGGLGLGVTPPAATPSVAITTLGADGIAGGGDDFTVSVSIVSGMTMQDFINQVNDATLGRMTASFNQESGQLIYDSAQRFTLEFSNGGATVDAGVAEIFAGASGSPATSRAYLAGGGNQIEGAAPTSFVTRDSPLDSAAIGVTSTETLNIVVGGDTFVLAGGDSQTLGQFIDRVSEATNGRVTAVLDQSAQRIVYRSSEDFTITATTGGVTGFIAPQTPTQIAGVAAPVRSGGSEDVITISSFDFRVGQGAMRDVTADLDISVDAARAVGAIDRSLANVNRSMAQLGSQAKALDMQKVFLTKLSDNLEKGVGVLVDADMARESARLQSMQIKQQLGVQALSIANSAPQAILSLFSGR